MTYTHSPRSLRRLLWQAATVIAFMAMSFVLGIQTAGDVKTVSTTEAVGSQLPGDVNGDSAITAADAHLAIEIAQGKVIATQQMLLADPNGDYSITLDDALAILTALEQK